ncbi:MAG: hypothetical protein HKP30_00945 [Myxococcales bacterium]|nr:hypothetical protein [Myxococcales bacterium]
MSPSPQYEFQGRTVTLPCNVRAATSGNATFLVDASVVRRLLPGDELVVPELLPGRSLCSIACIDYQDNDLGDYNEISIAFFVRERGAPQGIPYLGTALDMMRGGLGTWIWRLPVNQSFTCEAGCGIWGFPKTVESIEFEREGDRVACRWESDGRHVLTLRTKRGGDKSFPDREMSTYTWIEGVPHRTPFRSGASGVGFSLGGSELELGDHAVSETLRELGLPRRPLMSVWMEHMHGCFEAPEKL